MSQAKDNTPTTLIPLILDTNILHYYSTPNIRISIEPFIREISQSYKLEYYISSVTIAELLSGLKSKEEVQAIELLNTIKQYEITPEVLLASARLNYLYKEEGIADQQINLGDRIIASTSILTGAPILTANVNDFPRPYFLEFYTHLLTFQKKNKQECINLQILIPNTELINERFNKRK